jgi:hypothetical protein
MQFAESWVGPRFSPRLGFGAVLLMFAATGFVLAPQPSHHAIPAHIDFRHTNCSGAAATDPSPQKVETVDQILIANHDVDPYTPVFESADLAHCFGDETRIEMLVDIAADGHVSRVTHRPERPNRASRCIAHAVRHLQFPAADSPVSIRYAFTK